MVVPPSQAHQFSGGHSADHDPAADQRLLNPAASPLQIRHSSRLAHWPGLWGLLEPMFRAGETFPHDPAIPEAEARILWMEQSQAVLVALDATK